MFCYMYNQLGYFYQKAEQFLFQYTKGGIDMPSMVIMPVSVSVCNVTLINVFLAFTAYNYLAISHLETHVE